MVLQRDTEILIWGWATPGEKITIKTGIIRSESAIPEFVSK
jgi:hypothetical protein